MDGATQKPNGGPVMQGLLNRRIMGGNVKSKKKWFVLTGRRLQSFKSEQDFTNGGIFLDCFDLMELQTVRALTSQGHAKNAFEIVTRNKSVVFQSPSSEESGRWLTALRGVMMLRFSVSADLPEEKEETKKIEDELQRRRSNLKFWRNSRSSSSQQLEEDDVINSFDFLADPDVFQDDEEQEVDNDLSPDARPISASSGVESVSVEETPDDVVPNGHAHSEDEGISVATEEPASDETFEPLYENFTTTEVLPRRKSTPAIDELKEMVHYEEKMNAKENAETEAKGIEELRQLLASMP